MTSVQEHEVMYSRAAMDVIESTSFSQSQTVVSKSSSQVMSPASDTSSAFHEEPSPVPEPSLPEDFLKMDSSLEDCSNQYCERSEEYIVDVEQRSTLMSPKHRGDNRAQNTFHFREEHHTSSNVSMDSDATYRTAQQSISDTHESFYQEELDRENETLLAEQPGPKSPQGITHI